MLGHGSGFDSPGWNELRRVLPAPRAGVPRDAPRQPGSRSRDALRPGPRPRGALPARRGAARARRAGAALAHAPLPGRRARDRRQGRRHAGHARRAARPARHEDVVPGALGGSERADRALEGGARSDGGRGRRPPRGGHGLLQELMRAGHRQPARERDRAPRRCSSSTSRGTGSRASSSRAMPERAEPRRAHPGRRRPVARVPLPHGHRARRSGGVGSRPVVGRPRRRRGLGARRARHEGAGRRLGGRVRLARARGLHAVRRPRLHARGRRRGGRAPASGSAGSSRRIPDAARCDYAVNEGGGDRLALGGGPVYLCATAEKMSAPFRLRVHGRSGHASMPGIADNALVKAARYVEALGRLRAAAGADPGGARLPRGGPRRGASARGGARARQRAAPAARRARRAAALAHALADDDRGLAQAERHPGRLRGRRSTAACFRSRRPSDVEPLIRAAIGDGRLRARVARGGRAARGLRSRRRCGTRSPGSSTELEPGAALGTDRLPRVHGQPLPARGVRDGRVRLLPGEGDGRRGRDQARPLGERAHRGGRSRGRRRTCSATSRGRCSASEAAPAQA